MRVRTPARTRLQALAGEHRHSDARSKEQEEGNDSTVACTTRLARHFNGITVAGTIPRELKEYLLIGTKCMSQANKENKGENSQEEVDNGRRDEESLVCARVSNEGEGQGEEEQKKAENGTKDTKSFAGLAGGIIFDDMCTLIT